MDDTVLEFDGLTCRFGAFTAVDALTLPVDVGEIFRSARLKREGKTTTIKMLTTLPLI